MRIRHVLSLTATLALAVGLVTVPATPASAGEAIQEYGTVTVHGDGDTIGVTLSNGTYTKVRITGIQAPEIYSPNGVVSKDQCGAQASKAKLDALLPKGTKIALRALSKSSKSGDRLLRSVFKWGKDGYNDTAQGNWAYDVSRAMTSSGLVLWMPHPEETAHNREYESLAEAARAAKRGLWNPSYCGTGPAASLSMYVNWDATGDDSQNVNGEYFVVRNHASTALSIAGWMIRDTSLEWYVFPSGSTIGAKSWIRVRVGKGTRSGNTYYMGSDKTIFINPPVSGGPYVGDAGYLMDKLGNLRASFLYGCPSSCSDNALGKVSIKSVQSSGTASQEYVLLRNNSSVGVNLERYYLRHRYVRYTMGVSTYLPPGGQLAVHVGRGTRNATHQYMGLSGASLSSPGKVELMSLRNIKISCKAYGGATC